MGDCAEAGKGAGWPDCWVRQCERWFAGEAEASPYEGAQGGNAAAENIAKSLAAAAELTPWAEARRHGAGRRSRQHTKCGGHPSSNVIASQRARRFGGKPVVCPSKLMVRKQRKEWWLLTMCPRVEDLPGVEGNRAVKVIEKEPHRPVVAQRCLER